MTTINFTMMARWGLMQTIGAHVPPKDVQDKFDYNLIFHGIQKKIRVPYETRKLLMEELPKQGDDAFLAYAALPVEMEMDEVNKLMRFLRETEMPVAFSEWTVPLMNQLLEAAKEKVYALSR